MHGKYGIIRDAIRHHRPLLACRRGIWMTLCPYALGWRDEHPHLLAYACGDTPAWLCLPVVELSGVRLTDGLWLTAPAVPAADTEMDVVDVMATTLAPDPHPRTPLDQRPPAPA